MKLVSTLTGLLFVVLLIILAPSISRKLDGTDSAYRQQVALDLQQQAFDQSQAQAYTQAVAPGRVGLSYALTMTAIAALSLGLFVAYDRLYRTPLVRADEYGRLPMPRRAIAELSPSTDQTLMLIAQSMQQAFELQKVQAESMARLADSVRMSITVKDSHQAAVALPAGHDVPQLVAPSFDMLTGRIDLLERLHSTSADSLLLGVDQSGTELRGNLSTLMHTGLLAQTGGGKTTTLAAYALQLAGDSRVQLVIADPHMMELAMLEETGSFWRSAPNNMREAIAILKDTQKEIQRRAEIANKLAQRVQQQTGRRVVLSSLDRYNALAQRVQGAETFPALVLFADEIKALAAASDDTDAALQSITSEGRKFGIYFVGASQSWKSDVLSTDVRSQFHTRLALYGAQFRQVSELFEITQPDAKGYTAQLVAPGCAAIWRRAGGISVVKTPYVDLDSDAGVDAVYQAMHVIRERRNVARNGYSAPSVVNGSQDVVSSVASSVASDVALALGADKTPLLTENLVSIDIAPKKAKPSISADERNTIAQAAAGATSRRSLCHTLYGSIGSANYDKVKTVCDELGLLGATA
jgi:hypothetical protein